MELILHWETKKHPTPEGRVGWAGEPAQGGGRTFGVQSWRVAGRWGRLPWVGQIRRCCCRACG